MSTVPTHEQIAALTIAVRAGELTEQQRDLLASLLSKVENATYTPGATRYPNDIIRAAFWDQSCWRPVAEKFAALIETVSAPAPACLWCGIRPAPHVVLGDPLCAGCYSDHRAEVVPVKAER